jgi:hypothetical protein
MMIDEEERRKKDFSFFSICECVSV